ncbi:MAG: leucine-rich repeat domain-containing protein [Bacteroidetes bacterium]|jgi:Leucine-rich repeat (LRR) protein|nr:leucine-rich repeat domain-containing protein [Bacteroidota bacterium]MCA6443536.1 leucine-rich repeat domain-containing protein [Bacteroidota bacterium]
MLRKSIKLIILLCFIYKPLYQQQDEFDKWGVAGSMVYTDLKLALKIEKRVYKMDLSYKPVDLKQLDKLQKLTDLQVLKLSTNNVTAFPKNFDALTNLIYFASYNNALTTFIPNAKPFFNLHFLELQNTKIDSIPAQIAYLNKLETFRFGNTDDTLKLPSTLIYLKNLKELNLENCILDSFPKQVFKLPSLKYLFLSNTNTHYITKHFERLEKLEVLVIENNHLQRIPYDIYKAKNLRILSLRNNKLNNLPESISELINLTILDLRGNKIDNERIEELKLLLPGCEVKF